jgi:hypothetical protein
MTERPEQIVRKWQELKEMKKTESAVNKLFASIMRREKPRSLKKKGKK